MPSICTHTTRTSCSSWTPSARTRTRRSVLRPCPWVWSSPTSPSSWHARTRTCTSSAPTTSSASTVCLSRKSRSPRSITRWLTMAVSTRRRSTHVVSSRPSLKSSSNPVTPTSFSKTRSTLRTPSRGASPCRTCARRSSRCPRPRPTTMTSLTRILVRTSPATWVRSISRRPWIPRTSPRPSRPQSAA